VRATVATQIFEQPQRVLEIALRIDRNHDRRVRVDARQGAELLDTCANLIPI